MKVTEVDLPATITALTPLVTAAGVILIAWWQSRANKKAEASRSEVKAELKEATAEVKVIHKLVNSQHSHLLRTNANSARRLAMMTKAQSDIAVAEEAEKLLEDHLAAEREAAKQHLAETQAAMETLRLPQT